jgi:hypothetical protein
MYRCPTAAGKTQTDAPEKTLAQTAARARFSRRRRGKCKKTLSRKNKKNTCADSSPGAFLPPEAGEMHKKTLSRKNFKKHLHLNAKCAIMIFVL